MVSEKLGAAFIEIGVDTGGLTTGLAGAKAQVTGFGASASSAFLGLVSSINPATIAIAGATAAVAALGAGIVSSVGAAADFQQSMANVASVTGGGAAELEALSNAARKAGASTVFSAMEAADAQYFLASAGMNTNEIIAAQGDVLLLAGAGGLEMGRSAEIVTGTLAQFNMEVEETGRVVNVMAAAAAGSNTTINQIGEGMKNAGAFANAAGVSFEMTSAALMVFADSNIKGAEGGTALKSMIASLLTPSKGAADALAEMGLSVEDVSLETHTLDEVLQTLNDHQMTAAQSSAIFGKEMAGAGTVLVGGAGDLQTYTAAITGTTKAQEMYNTQMGTFRNAMKMVESAVTEAKISLGSVFLPALTTLAGGLALGVTAVTNFGKALGSAFASSSLAGSLKSFGSLISTELSSGFAAGKAMLAEFNSAFEAVFGSSLMELIIDGATKPLSMVVDALEAILSATAPIRAAIQSGVVQAVSEIATKIKEVSQFAKDFIGLFKDTDSFKSLQESWDKFKSAYESTLTAAKARWDETKTAIGNVVNEIQVRLQPAVQWVSDKFEALVGWIERIAGVDFSDLVPGIGKGLGDREGLVGDLWRSGSTALALATGRNDGEAYVDGMLSETDAIPEAVDGQLEEIDGEGAGEKVGKDFGESFTDTVSKLVKEKGMSREIASMYALGATSDLGALGLYNQYFSSDTRRKEGAAGYESGGVQYTYQWDRTSKNPTLKLYANGKQIKKVASVDYSGLMAGIDTPWSMMESLGISAPKEGSPEYLDMMAAYRESVGKTTEAITLRGEAETIRIKMKIEPEIDPYEVWGTSQHWADYSAKYWGEIEDLTILELYNLEEALRNEGAAGWERAWETILDPDATEAAITGALGVLSPVLEDMGYEDADSYLLGLRERVAESGAELADSIVDAGKYQEYKLEELGATWGKALGDSMIDAQEKKTLLGLVVALELAGYEGAAALRAAILAEDWEGLGAMIGDRTGDAMEKTLFGRELRMKDIPALSDLISDPDKLKQTVQNWDQWSANTYQPALQNHIDEASAKWESGYYSQSELNKDYFQDLMTNALQYSDWYEGWQLGLLGAYARGDIGLQQFFDLWENGGKAIEGASKAIAEECQNLASLTAEASMCEEAMSDFGIAQEKMSDQLFNRSYIGPTSGYAAFLEEERARGAYHPEAQQLSMVYRVEADTEAAEKSVEDLKTDIDQSEAAPQIDAITQPAYDAVDSFLGWVNNISASVFVDAYGPGTEYTGGGGYLESLSPGITSSPDWGTPSWLPVLDSGGIVTGPTIASLAQDNRPEAIIPLDQITKIIGGGGGNTYNISVNGGGNAEEIARAIRGAIEDYDREKNRSGAYA